MLQHWAAHERTALSRMRAMLPAAQDVGWVGGCGWTRGVHPSSRLPGWPKPRWSRASDRGLAPAGSEQRAAGGGRVGRCMRRGRAVGRGGGGIIEAGCRRRQKCRGMGVDIAAAAAARRALLKWQRSHTRGLADGSIRAVPGRLGAPSDVQADSSARFRRHRARILAHTVAAPLRCQAARKGGCQRRAAGSRATIGMRRRVRRPPKHLVSGTFWGLAAILASLSPCRVPLRLPPALRGRRSTAR